MLQLPEVALTTVAGHLLVMLRISAWLVLTPPFSHKSIPARVKVLLSLGLTFAVGSTTDFSGLSVGTADLVVSALEQVLLGAALGYLCYLLFAAVQAAGTAIDFFGGFQAATVFDPSTGGGASVFGRLYQLVAVTLLFVSDGYLVVLHGLTSTFSVLGVQEGISLDVLARLATEGTAQMFLSALQIAGPIIAVLFLTDVGLGLLTRAAPALQVFSLGFPLKIMITLAVSATAVAALPSVVDSLAQQASTQVVSTAATGAQATGALPGAAGGEDR